MRYEKPEQPPPTTWIRRPAYGSGCSLIISLTLSSAFLVNKIAILTSLLWVGSKEDYTQKIILLKNRELLVKIKGCDLSIVGCACRYCAWSCSCRPAAIQCDPVLLPAGQGRRREGLRGIEQSHGSNHHGIPRVVGLEIGRAHV